ncbi:MAG: phosphatidate cytidylyltransferase [Bradymonadales bacterium]|jgi:phosphatidate cytidylyltransferase
MPKNMSIDSQNTTEDKKQEEQQTSAQTAKRSNLFFRVVSSAVALPLLLALIIFSPASLWAAFVGVAAFLGLREWLKMLSPSESGLIHTISACIALIPAIGAYLFLGDTKVLDINEIYYADISDAFLLLVLASMTMWATFLFHSLRRRDINHASSAITATLSGSFYVVLGFLVLALFKRDFPMQANAWIFTLMAMTWLSDTGAYFTGRKFGKHKLAPILSPKKTIEGAIGGLLAAIVAGLGAKYFAFPDLSIASVVLLAVVSNIFAQTGDLAESLIKRSCKVKDSGKLIPGHGGLLDRVDALIFSAPWVYIFATFSVYAY